MVTPKSNASDGHFCCSPAHCYMNVRTYTGTYTHVHTSTDTYIHRYSCASTLTSVTCSTIRTDAHKGMRIYLHPTPHTHTRTHVHTYTNGNMYTHTHPLTPTHTHVRTWTVYRPHRGPLPCSGRMRTHLRLEKRLKCVLHCTLSYLS